MFLCEFPCMFAGKEGVLKRAISEVHSTEAKTRAKKQASFLSRERSQSKLWRLVTKLGRKMSCCDSRNKNFSLNIEKYCSIFVQNWRAFFFYYRICTIYVAWIQPFAGWDIGLRSLQNNRRIQCVVAAVATILLLLLLLLDSIDGVWLADLDTTAKASIRHSLLAQCSSK